MCFATNNFLIAARPYAPLPMFNINPKHPPTMICISQRLISPLFLMFTSDQNMERASQVFSPTLPLILSMVVFGIPSKENLSRLPESHPSLSLFLTQMKCNYVKITFVTCVTFATFFTSTSQQNHLSTDANHLQTLVLVLVDVSNQPTLLIHIQYIMLVLIPPSIKISNPYFITNPPKRRF